MENKQKHKFISDVQDKICLRGKKNHQHYPSCSKSKHTEKVFCETIYSRNKKSLLRNSLPGQDRAVVEIRAMMCFGRRNTHCHLTLAINSQKIFLLNKGRNLWLVQNAVTCDLWFYISCLIG